MNKPKPSSITAEEAVARMINLDYVPSGFTITQMTAAYLEMAEVEYGNARAELRPAEQIAVLKIQMEACKSRHSLAESLLEALCREIDNPKDSTVIHSSEKGLSPRVTPDSVSDWVFEVCGISMPLWSQTAHGNTDARILIKGLRWEDVTIKLYADYRIGCKLGNDNYKRSSFQDIGLMGRSKIEPSELGGLLVGLSMNRKFPAGKEADGKSKTAISKLRKSLIQLVGIADDPFITFNEADGWKPRFKLIDDRRNAADRAKERAVHVPLDEARDFDAESDATQDWLDKNDR